MPSPRSASARSRTQASPRPGSRATAPRRVSGPRRLTPARVRWERVGRVALVIVLLVVAGLYVQHALAYWSAHNQAASDAAVVRNLKADNARLAQQQRALRDPSTIVLDARRLGMVRPGERPYVVTGLPNH
jgi:cell division protein FtsB